MEILDAGGKGTWAAEPEQGSSATSNGGINTIDDSFYRLGLADYVAGHRDTLAAVGYVEYWKEHDRIENMAGLAISSAL